MSSSLPVRGVAGCGSRTQGATRSSAISVGDIPERPHRRARRRPLRAHQRPRQRRQSTDPHLQRGTQGRALPVREPRSRRICQDLLINTSQGRGLAGSGSASLGAGYNQQGFALVVDALVVTAAPHPRGTARRESTPRDLAALCAVKAASEAAPANSWTRVCLVGDADKPKFARRSAQFPAYCSTCF